MNRRPGVIGIAAFFAFGALMASLATLTLLMPASNLQGIWRLNPQAHDGLVRMGFWGIGLMGVVAFYRGDLRTLIGVPIGAALIAYLLSRRVRADCQQGPYSGAA
jgi:hypothetical protein